MQLRGLSGLQDYFMWSASTDERRVSHEADIAGRWRIPSSPALLPSSHSSVNLGRQILHERGLGVDEKGKVWVCVLTGQCMIGSGSVSLVVHVHGGGSIHGCWPRSAQLRLRSVGGGRESEIAGAWGEMHVATTNG